VPEAFQLNSPLPGGQSINYYTWNDYFFFVQDEWRVRPDLTVNLGLRYELVGNTIEPLVELNEQILAARRGDVKVVGGGPRGYVARMVRRSFRFGLRLGILALPISGVLTLVGLLSRYGTPNPRIDAKAAARTAGSMSYFVTQFVGNVVGLTMLIFGIIALTALLARTRAKNLALAAMILSILGIAPVLSALGVTTYALPVLGQAYLEGQRGTLTIVDAIFNNPLRIIFVFVFIIYAAGFILFGAAIWLSGVLRKGAAISLGLHAPLVATFARSQPSPAVVLGALLFLLGATFVARDVFRLTPLRTPNNRDGAFTEPGSKH
jgi:hypothetical protein